MRTLFSLFSILVCSCGASFAQDGFFITATGYGCITGNLSGPSDASEIASGLKSGINIGYQRNRWQFSTGIHYLETGYQQDIFYNNNFNPDTPLYQQFKFRHILVPLEVGYELLPGRRFGLIPSAGLAFSHNTAMRYLSNNGNYERTVKNTEFSMNYNAFSFFAHVGFHVRYKINDQFSLLAGYQSFFMLSNLNKLHSSAEPDIYTYTVQGGAGLCYRF